MERLRIIERDSLEELLKTYGVFIEIDEQKMSIVESYPPLPNVFREKKIINVNDANPLIKNAWKKGKNIIEFENHEKRILILEELEWDKILYSSFVNGRNYIVQCTNFEQDNELYVPHSVENIVLDLRYNFGGKLKDMNKWYCYLKKILIQREIKKIYILVSNATCSAAEILVEKMGKLKNCYIVGSETFGKKYVYRILQDEKRTVYIPEYSLNTKIKINQFVHFYYFYEMYYLNQKKEYIQPDIWKISRN